MGNDKLLFKSEHKVSFEAFDEYQDRIEKKVIFNFLNGLPIEKLKSLVEFELTDPRKIKANSFYQNEENNYLLDGRFVKIETKIKL